jgi:hypothetical protein
VSIKAPAAQASIGRIALDRMLAIIPCRQEIMPRLACVHFASELPVFYLRPPLIWISVVPKSIKQDIDFQNETPPMAAERKSALSRIYFRLGINFDWYFITSSAAGSAVV